MNIWLLWGGVTAITLIIIFVIARATKNSQNFIFGKTLGERMAKIKQRTQYESSLLGFSFVLLSLIIMIVRYAFFSPEMAVGWRIFYGLNSFFGILIVFGFLITQFQQYKSYMESEAIQKAFKDEKPIEIVMVKEEKDGILE